MFKAFVQMLSPGFGEELKTVANVTGNLAWHGIGSGIIYGRNFTYIGAVLMVTGTVGVIRYNTAWPLAVSIPGVCLFALGVRCLWNMAGFITKLNS